MEKFKIQPSQKNTIMKTIRLPEKLNNKISKIIENANKGKNVKQYSFNKFVCSACEFALENLSEEFKDKKDLPK